MVPSFQWMMVSIGLRSGGPAWRRPLSSVLLLSSCLAVGACGGSASPSDSPSSDAGSPDTSTLDARVAEASAPDASDAAACTPAALKPAPSELYVLFDKSSGMRDYFGANGASQALAIGLSDPLIASSEIALAYPPGPQSDCAATDAGNSFATPSVASGEIPFEPASQASTDIANSIAALAGADGGGAILPAGSSPWYLEAALEGGSACVLRCDRGELRSVRDSGARERRGRSRVVRVRASRRRRCARSALVL